MITIKKIAQQLNLSPATVSLALNGSPLVAEKTRERVKAAAAALDYVPNNFGRGLQSRRSRLVGYICSSVRNSFNAEIMECAGRVAAENGYGVLVGVAGRDYRYFKQELQMFLEKHVDGILLSSDFMFDGAAYPDFIRKAEQRELPVLLVASHAVNLDFPLVDTDHRKGGYLSVGHLAGLGHKHICYARADVFADRWIGYESAARDYGVKLTAFGSCMELNHGILKDRSITAVACNSDYSAIDLLAFLGDNGLRVPEDVSVVGFDDVWYASYAGFSLTTVAQQRSTLGELAMHTMIDMVNGAVPPGTQLVEPALVVRHSTCPPSR